VLFRSCSRLVHVAPEIGHVTALPWLAASGGARAGRLVERNLVLYRRTWIVLFSGFFEPLFYLLGIGVGVGSLVGSLTVGGQSVGYAAFVAPALMATSAMNGAIYDSTFNMFHKLKFTKLYDGILVTPLGIMDIALGEVTWALMRGSLYAISFIVVMVALHLAASPWSVLAVPAAILVGFAFAAAGTATTTFLRKWQDFDLVFLLLLPLFLFSATFYPVTLYPGPIRVIVELTPLYHGVALIRGLTTGVIDASLLGHVVYLVLFGIGGLLVASRRLQILLVR